MSELQSTAFFQKIVQSRGTLISFSALPIDSSASILTDAIAADKGSGMANKVVGHFRFNITYELASGVGGEAPGGGTFGGDVQEAVGSLDVVVKAKPTSDEFLNLVIKFAHQSDSTLGATFERHRNDLGFRSCSDREVAIARMAQESSLTGLALGAVHPVVYSSGLEPVREVFFYTMEFLAEKSFSHIHTVHDPSCWTDEHICVVLDGAARMHAQYMAPGECEQLRTFTWIDPPNRERMARTVPLWHELLTNNRSNWPELWPDERAAFVEILISHLDDIWAVLEGAPKTLIHNDFNPRNLALRRATAESSTTLCAYDWELATIHVPQRDVVEFLAFVLPPNRITSSGPEDDTESAPEMFHHFYRTRLELHSGRTFDEDHFTLVMRCAAADLAVTRLQLYGLVHTFKEYQWLDRVLGSCFGYLSRVWQPLAESLRGAPA